MYHVSAQGVDARRINVHNNNNNNNIIIIIIIIIPLPTVNNGLLSQQSVNERQMELKTGEAECHQQIIL